MAAGRSKRFWDFLAEFRSLTSWVAKMAVAAPLADLILGIGPPWPSRVAVPVLTSLLTLLVLMHVFQSWRGLERDRLARRFRGALALTALSLAAYMSLFAFFVYDAPEPPDREVRGLVYTSEAQIVIDSGVRESEAVRGAGYDPLRIWRPWSVHLMRLVVLAAWLLLFASLASSIGSFVLLEGDGYGRAVDGRRNDLSGGEAGRE